MTKASLTYRHCRLLSDKDTLEAGEGYGQFRLTDEDVADLADPPLQGGLSSQATHNDKLPKPVIHFHATFSFCEYFLFIIPKRFK